LVRDVLTGTYFTQGAVACGEGAIAAGCRFFAGYPITPATTIAEHLTKRLPEVGGSFIQTEDEIAAISSVIGASYAGIKAMTATSGPGFSLMAENIGLAVMTETPLVIAYVMRAGPSTGQATKTGQQDVMQVKWCSHGDYELIVIAPMTVQEMFDLTINAFNFSEQYRVPVILLADAIVASTRERLTIPRREQLNIFNRKKPRVIPDKYLPYRADVDLVPPMACFGEGYHTFATGITHDETGMPDPDSAETHTKLVRRLCDKIRKNIDKITITQSYMLEDADIAIVAYGTPCRSALNAIKKARQEGLKTGVLRLVTIWPFPDEIVAKATENARAIIVPEMNYGQIVREVERAVKNKPVYLLSKLGEEIHMPNEILEMIRRV
jgi:2-oxoglutarate ferredoxin oxidoreductase subunit alpha